MWEHWNEALHHNPENWMSILESVVNDKIRQFYVISMASLPHDAMGFLLLEEQLLKPLTNKTLWVESIEAAILRKARHDYGVMMGEQWLMWQFLGLDWVSSGGYHLRLKKISNQSKWAGHSKPSSCPKERRPEWTTGPRIGDQEEKRGRIIGEWEGRRGGRRGIGKGAGWKRGGAGESEGRKVSY